MVTTAYSFMLKRLMVIDIFCLAFLYTIRIVAGTVLYPNTPSFWLFVFSVFIFLSLASLKRYTELVAMSEEHERKLIGRDYSRSDMSMLRSVGVTSGFSASVVFAFYIDSDVVQNKYYWPELLWVTAATLLYWTNYI